jgi:hypothetical protein
MFSPFPPFKRTKQSNDEWTTGVGVGFGGVRR